MVEPIRTAVVIPAFNAAAAIHDIAERSKSLVDEVIVVDDGSTDKTFQEACSAEAIVVRHERNRGKGAAIATGLSEAARLGARVVVTLDADGQHDPAFIPALLGEFERGPRAIVLGSRKNMDDPAVPRSSRRGLAISNFWVKVETGLTLCDTQTGMRAYPLPEVLSLACRSRRFGWEIEMLVRAAWAGIPIREVDIDARYDQGQGPSRRFRPFRDNFLISLTHARLVTMRWLGLGR